MDDVNIKTAPIGYPFTRLELENQCRAIIGGVAWPAKRPGFARKHELKNFLKLALTYSGHLR